MNRHARQPAAPKDLESRGNAFDRLMAGAHRAGYFSRAYIRPIVRLRVPIVSVTGTGAFTSERHRVVVAGWKHSVEYLIHRYFSRFEPPETIQTVPLALLPRTLRALRDESDAVFARVPGPGSRWLFDSSYLHVPEAIEARLDIPATADDLAVASTRARRNIARVRENGLYWSLSRDVADFELFYSEYYLPFLRKRYAELAVEIDHDSLLRTFRSGCLIWIMKDGRRLAGALLERRGFVLHYRVMGAITEGIDPAKLGALSAIYLFSVECARLHGMRWLDLGYSKPSPRDGVLSHKCSWGARVHCPWHVDHDVLVSWTHFHADLAHFLHETPLIVRDGRGLSVVTALAPGSSGSAAAHGRKVGVRGLDTVYVLGADPGAQPPPEATQAPRIIALPAGASAGCMRRR